MAKIRRFGDMISEGKIDSKDTETRDKFIAAFKKAFHNAEISHGYGNQDKIYNYKDGYVEHPITCKSSGWDCVDPNSAKILEACGLQPLTTKAYFFLYEPISDAAPRVPRAWIGFLGDKYLNNNHNFDKEITTGKFDPAMKAFKATCIKEGFNEDLLKSLFGGWKKSSYKEAHKDTKNWGLGSQAVTYITKKFDSSYIIRDLDLALKMPREKVEETIKNHWMFKKDNIKFDWDGGVMYVNGEYGETWD